MNNNRKIYSKEYKVQAVKLTNEILKKFQGFLKAQKD